MIVGVEGEEEEEEGKKDDDDDDDDSEMEEEDDDDEEEMHRSGSVEAAESMQIGKKRRGAIGKGSTIKNVTKKGVT